MRALRACLALACVVVGVTTLPDGVSAGAEPTRRLTVTYDATAARDPDALHGQVVLRHDTDEDPHKLLIEPPAPPAGLTAEQGRVGGEVKLSWNAPAPADDIDHHDYRYHTAGRYSVWITIPASGSSSNHVGYVNGLTGGVAHTFQVRAINTNGAPGLPSATVTVTPRGGAPPTREGAGGDPAGVVTLELSPSSIGEDSEVSTVTASLDSASATALTVTVSAEAVAPAAPGDFTLSANRTLAIAVGELTSTGSVTISADDNSVDAPDKDVTVSGTVAGATDVTGPSDVTLTITDDDVPTPTICTGGNAGVNLCDNVDLMSYLAMNDIGGGVGVDIWGWADSSTGKEYAIMGRSTGTAFVDISDPVRPTYLGNLPPHSGSSQWRDMKVYLDHAFIVSEASDGGMQVFDLTQLRTVSSPPVTFSETAHYAGFSDAHNIAINEDSGFAYAVGTDTCDGGPHMVNIQDPANPTSAGCFSDDGYTHDAQCVNYIGPDPDHQGAEICFNSNTDTLTIVDVTNKAAPEMLSRTGYAGSGYTHQGWLTEDHAYFVLGDELDESADPPSVTGTATYLWDVSDLDSPTLTGTHVSTTTRAVDHNQYVKGKYTYQSNYQAGLRILDVTDIVNGKLTEVAFFDMLPDSDSYRSYAGAWGNYPFFDSGIVIVSVRTQGLYVLRPNLVDRIQPKVGRAVVDRETLTLTYGEALDETSTPAIDAFAVAVEGAARSVSGVSVSGSAVALTLASAVTVAEEVTVTYTVPETSPIRDEARNNAPILSSRGVRNDTTGPPGTPGAPAVTAASATSLTVTWAEPPNAKPPITDYDVQYGIGNSGSFTDWPHTGTALTATVPRLTEGTTYEVQVLARNPEGMSSWSPSGSGTLAPPPNTAPTASATATTPTTVNGLGTVMLDGSANDPEGDTLTYRWTSSGGGIFDPASALHTTWTAPAKAAAAQDIVLTLTVTDDGTGRLTDAAEVNVRVRENQRPTAEVSPDIATVDGGEEVELKATASDPDTTTLTYDWTSSGGTFDDPSALDTTWTAPPKTNAAQDITLTLTVTDDGYAERAATVTVQVTVRANLAPEATATATTPTTVSGGGTVTLHGTANDPDGDSLRHTWSSNGGGSFHDASALDTTWTAPRKTNDVQNIVLTLTVTEDGYAERAATVTVQVTVRANLAPEATATATTPTIVNGGGTVTLHGTANDPDGDRLRHTWSSNGGGSFDNASLDPIWTAPPQINALQNIVLTLTVTEDRAGARTETANVDVRVRANRAPDVTATATPTTVNGDGTVMLRGTATDSDGDSLRHTWSSNGGGSFVNASALDPTWTAPRKTNDVQNIVLTLTVTEDRVGARTETANVDVRVRKNRAPRVTVSPTTATVDGGEEVALDGMASDRDDGTLTYRWSSDGGGAFDDDEALVTPWFAPRATAANERLVLTLTVTDSANASASATASVTVRANQAPRVTVSPSTARVDGEEVLAVSGSATDPEGDRLTYIWSSNGAGTFDDDAGAADTTWTAPATTADVQNITLTLTVTDNGAGRLKHAAEVRVTVPGNTPPPDPITSGGGGGGGGGGPSPSVVDFEWTVTRDIDELGGGHDTPSGTWSDGATLWVLENGDGADDAIYAYDLATGERVEDREFELDETNRAPRGVWSNREVLWVSDSGQERLFAHDLETGERLPERDIALADRNRDARGIWSDGSTMWVLDGGKNALFVYDLESGDLVAEYALDAANGDPHGLFFDGVTFWVSDHVAKRLFAYRIEAGEDGEDALERNRDEEFPNTVLSRSGNNSPRGLWSDGEVMYVADESDDRVYSYNMPDAIDARLTSLTLSDVEFGEFSPGTPGYEGVAADGVTETTVEATAAQSRASVVIKPPDADGIEGSGHQVALDGIEAITATVTSADGSRERVYRVRLGAPEQPDTSEPEAGCFRGDVAVGFSLVVYEGGSIDDLEACARSRHVTAVYLLDDGVYVSYILGAPDFVNDGLEGLYRDGMPALTPLIVASDGPATAAAPAADVTAPWPDCPRGAIAEGFSLVVYEGGSIEDLDACAADLDVAALYVLAEGEWVSYILGAPGFVNADFRARFPDGLGSVTPLVVKHESPSQATDGSAPEGS